MDVGAELETQGITISSAKTDDNGNVLEKLEASQTQSFLLLAQLMQKSFNDMSANICKAIKETTGSTHTSNEGEPSKRAQEAGDISAYPKRAKMANACSGSDNSHSSQQSQDGGEEREDKNEEDSDRISIPDQDTIDKDIENMLGNDNVPAQSQQSTQILTQISEDICQGTDVGEDIKPELAKIINNLWKSKCLLKN